MKTFIILSLAAAACAVYVPHFGNLVLRNSEDNSIANLVAFGEGQVAQELRRQMASPNSTLGEALKLAFLRLNNRFAFEQGFNEPSRYGHGLEIALGLAYLDNVKSIRGGHLPKPHIRYGGHRLRGFRGLRGGRSQDRSVDVKIELKDFSPAPSVLPSALPSALPSELPSRLQNKFVIKPLDKYSVKVNHLVQSFDILKKHENKEIRNAFNKVVLLGGRAVDQEALAFLLLKRGVQSLEAAGKLKRDLVRESS